MAERSFQKLSVVIPLYNEQDVLPMLVERLITVLDQIPGHPHQVVFANDGSRDQTSSLLDEIALSDPRVTVVHLSRNFGHQLALSAALDYATGDLIVMMDGDLQDRPEIIPQFIDLWREGNDVVYAVRVQRKESWLLRTCYLLFYRVIERVSHLKLPRDSGDFCLITQEVADVIRRSRERHRYIRGLRTWAGFQQTGCIVERDARSAGTTKYSWKQLFGLAFDGIFSFSVVPLRMATWLGIVVIAITILLGVFWVVAWFLDYSPQGFTALATSIAFFSGVQLVFLGLIGEYIGRIYEEIKGRPLYIVSRVKNDCRNQSTTHSAS